MEVSQFFVFFGVNRTADTDLAEFSFSRAAYVMEICKLAHCLLVIY